MVRGEDEAAREDRHPGGRLRQRCERCCHIGRKWQPEECEDGTRIGAHTRGLAAEEAIVARTSPAEGKARIAEADCSRNTATETCARLVISAASPTMPAAISSP